MLKHFLLFVCFLSFCVTASATPDPDAIIGQWMSTRRNVRVQVYKEGNEFRGRVVWFKDSDDPTQAYGNPNR